MRKRTVCSGLIAIEAERFIPVETFGAEVLEVVRAGIERVGFMTRKGTNKEQRTTNKINERNKKYKIPWNEKEMRSSEYKS